MSPALAKRPIGMDAVTAARTSSSASASSAVWVAPGATTHDLCAEPGARSGYDYHVGFDHCRPVVTR